MIDLYTTSTANQAFLVGTQYSIADITVLPAVITQEQKLADYPHLTRWLLQLKQRPAVQRGMLVPIQEVSNENL